MGRVSGSVSWIVEMRDGARTFRNLTQDFRGRWRIYDARDRVLFEVADERTLVALASKRDTTQDRSRVLRVDHPERDID